MNLRKQIGKLIITDISSPDIDKSRKEYEKLLIEHNVGGIMLFNELRLKNFPIKIENQLINEEQSKNLISELKSYNPNLFIAVDLEGGLVDRLHHIRKKRYKSPKEIGLTNEEFAYNYFKKQGKYIKEIGFNMNASPVLDAVSAYNDKYLMAYQKRSFSNDEDLVSKLGSSCIKGLKESNIIPIGKHFPGLGQVKKGFDPHFDFPKIKKITKKSLKPFLYNIYNGLDAIMTTHLIVEEYGKDIATKNRNIIKILRNYGYEGIIMTDDICFMSTGMINKKREMGPTKENISSIVDTAYNSIKAGHDMILTRQLGCVNNPETDFIGMITRRIEEGLLSNDINLNQFIDSFQRVSRIRTKYLKF